MENKSNVMLVIQTRVKPDRYSEYNAWQKKLTQEIEKFPGYISQKITEPNPPIQLDTIITETFDSIDAIKNWLQSNVRQNLIREILPTLLGIDSVYIIQEGHDYSTVSASIATKIKLQDEQKFLDWQSRIAPIQSKFPGFLGYKIDKPKKGIQDNWITIITFDSDEHLDSWLNSEERAHMLKELSSFSSESSLQKIHAGFDFWFKKPDSGRSIWKENMLVLLTLYPIVFILSYIQKPIIALGVPFWFSLFISNAVSTAILGWVTVPWLMSIFYWWIRPKNGFRYIYNILGTLIVLALYAVILFICSKIAQII